MKRTTTVFLALVLCACGQHTESESASSIFEAAVADANRPEADRSRDAGRRPAEVLAFMGIAPGMTVLDMYSGGGYYTEIMSRVVGDNGKVVAHSNQAYLQFVGDEFEQRYLNGRLANAQILMAENNELQLEPESFDAVMLVLAFHDLYYAAPEDGWPAVDIETFLAELHKGLRPGGIMGIVDHYAADGAPSETGGTTHRIDPAIVREAMDKAGFVLDGQSDLLRNPDDDYDTVVFDPAVRGKTDRFVLRFRKAS